MTFMMAGIKKRWKLVVSFHFTKSGSFDAKIVKDIIFDLIRKGHQADIYTKAYIQDQSTGNNKV